MLLADIIGLSIIAFSAIVGFYRGFINEVMRFLIWGFAGAATYLTYYNLPKELEVYTFDLLGTTLSVILFFIFYLIVFKVLHYLIGLGTKGKLLQFIDQPLGLLFGLLRGVFMVTLIYIMCQALLPFRLEADISQNIAHCTIEYFPHDVRGWFFEKLKLGVQAPDQLFNKLIKYETRERNGASQDSDEEMLKGIRGSKKKQLLDQWEGLKNMKVVVHNNLQENHK